MDGEIPRDVSHDQSLFVLQNQQDSGGSFVSKTDSIFGALGGIEKKYQSNLTERQDDYKKRGFDGEEEDEKVEGHFKKPNLPGHSSRDRRSEKASDTTKRSDSSSRSERDHYRSQDDRAGERRWGNRNNYSRPPRGRFHQPDYKMNPEKWTAYTLEDTCESEEKSNRSIALDFITELKKRKQDEKMDEGNGKDSDCKNKIEFHKPSKHDDESDDISGKRKNYGSVYRMSEYVIGATKKPKSRHHTTTDMSASDAPSTISNLALDHLADEEDASDSRNNKTEISQDTIQPPGSKPPVAAVDNPVDLSSTGDQTTDIAKRGDQIGSDKEKTQFKFGKGKGKRKIRARQVDDDGE